MGEARQISRRVKTWARGAMAAMLLVAAGCASSSAVRPFARYRPDVDRLLVPEVAGEPAAAVAALEAPGVATSTAGATEPGMSMIRKGDRIAVSLRGIPQPEEIQDVVDDAGMINLPYINRIKVAGFSTSDAEDIVERAYIDGGYYSSITAIIVAQENEYFVIGEVKKEGRYTFSGERTLLEAVTIAGGYSEYADPRKITIKRGDEALKFNAKKIEANDNDDPLVQAGDIIRVPRHWL